MALPLPEPVKLRPPAGTTAAAAAAAAAAANAKSSLPDCTVTTSAASHSWHPASPGPLRPKRSVAPAKPSEARRAEGQSDVELENMNRNNSSQVKTSGGAVAVPSLASTNWTPAERGSRPRDGTRYYKTVPAGGVRVNRRHSLNVDSYAEQRCYEIGRAHV